MLNDDPRVLAHLGHAYASSGKKIEALKIPRPALCLTGPRAHEGEDVGAMLPLRAEHIDAYCNMVLRDINVSFSDRGNYRES